MSNVNIKRYVLTGVLIVITVVLAGCKEKKQEPISKSAFKLDTSISITLYDSNDENILSEAMELVDKYERVYSRTLETSELYQLNNHLLPNSNGEPLRYQISDELEDIIEQGIYYSTLSDGAFDITIEPITSIWDFKSKDAKVPAKELIEEAVKKVGYKNILLEDNEIIFHSDFVSLDLGGIAKGYIADRIADYLMEQGVKSAIINLGGNVVCIGEKPNGDGFTVGIQKPFSPLGEVIATMELKDMSIVTSGIYERYLMEDDKLYHHIINPSTGYSYENNLISVTIISQKSVDGDGLSTACFGLGLEEGMALVNNMENVYGLFITDDYTFHYSEDFLENISVTERKD